MLDPPTRLYQRLLARDGDEANDLAHELLAERGIDAVYDEVLVAVLGLAERDRRRRRLDPERHGYIRQRMREIISDLAETARLQEVRRQADAAVAAAKGEAADATSVRRSQTPPRRSGRPASQSASSACRRRTWTTSWPGACWPSCSNAAATGAVAASPEHLATEMLDRVARERADVVCVSALPPAAIPHSRYLVKRLFLRFPELPTLVGLWTEKGDPDRAKSRISPSARLDRDHAGRRRPRAGPVGPRRRGPRSDAAIGVRTPLAARFGQLGTNLPRPVLRERAGVRVIRGPGARVIPITRCSGDFDHQVLATPAHRVRQITLTLPSPGVPGEGNEPGHFRSTRRSRLPPSLHLRRARVSFRCSIEGPRHGPVGGGVTSR